MLHKGIFSNKTASFQLFVLLSLLLAGAIVSSLLSVGILFLAHGIDADMYQHPNALRTIQLVSAMGTFLLPALATAWLCSNKPSEYLSVNTYPTPNVWLLTFISMLLLSPSITLAGLLNKAMTLPEFMKPIEIWMQNQESTAERLTALLLAGDSLFILLFNLLVIAIAAGVTEEFLFRGALQRIMEKWTSNHHTVIWSVAILFSAFHLQFYGFLPRLLLGAYLGYLLFWSKSIWVPVFAHFTNNAMAVVVMSCSDLKENELISGEIPTANIPSFAIGASLTFVLFYFCVKQLCKQLPSD